MNTAISNWQKTKDVDDFANSMRGSKTTAVIRLMNYKQAGNSIAVLVVQRIAEQIRKALN